MKCAWYEEQLANESAELWRNRRPSASLADHARRCAICDRTIERELQLKLMFTQLAEQARVVEPSASVKHNLLAELGTIRPQKQARFNLIPRFAIAAAAIACLALILLFARRSPVSGSQDNVAKAPTQQTVPAAQTPTVQQPAPVAVQAVVKAAPKVGKRSVHPRGVAQQNVETANDFYPMVMCDSITCAGPAITVRVELPASQFSARRGSGRKVMADLLVGEDGLVRGVRLLQ